MNRQSAREAWRACKSLAAELSWPTRVILAGYGLYVVGFWIFAIAPGEVAFEHATVRSLHGELARATSMVRADDRWVAVDLAASDDRPAEIAIVDLSGDVGDDATIAVVPNVGRAHSAALRGDVLHVLTESDDGRSALTVSLDNGDVDVTAIDPRSLWIFGDGTAMGHELMSWLVEQTWNTSLASTPAVVSSDMALLRIAASDGQRAPDGTWAVPPSATPDDFVIASAHDSEPVQLIDTVRLNHVAPAPARSGFLYVAEGFPGFVWCPQGECEDRSVHVRTETHPIAAIDHHHGLARIAVCTPSELYLYEGEPGEDEVIFLGRADLSAACERLAIVDDRSVWIAAVDTPARIVRFSAESEP
jgi:hypothetical protein